MPAARCVHMGAVRVQRRVQQGILGVANGVINPSRWVFDSRAATGQVVAAQDKVRQLSIWLADDGEGIGDDCAVVGPQRVRADRLQS